MPVAMPYTAVRRTAAFDVAAVIEGARADLPVEDAIGLATTADYFPMFDVPLRYRGFGAAERATRVKDALTQVGLASRMRHYPAELSGGQQQRVAIARALAGSPKLMLADEPTGNLDTQMARSVMELLEEINARGTTILMVTHDPELAVRAQRNVHIIDGQVSDLVRGMPSLIDPAVASRAHAAASVAGA